MFEDDHANAEELFREAVPRLRQLTDSVHLGWVLRRLGQLAMYRGDFITARSLINSSLETNWSVHDSRGLGACLAALGELSALQNQIDRAVRLLGAASKVSEFIHTPLLPYDQQHLDHDVGRLRAQVDADTFAAAWEWGRELNAEQSIEYALQTGAEHVQA